MADVFVSYKAEDRERVEPLVEALQADGFKVWWDAHISAGSQWREDIQAQLDKAKCVIVVWSRRSVGPNGRFVRDEAARSQRQGTYLPVRIDRVHPPLGFGEVQSIPLQSWKGNRSDPRYLALLDCIGSIIAGERPTATIAEPPLVSRRTALAGGAVAVVAAAGGGWLLLKPAPASAHNSIAVLPFANLSGDPRQDYFSDGIAEELRSGLAQLPNVKVAGRISSEVVSEQDSRTAARRLRVDSLLTGSVRRAQGVVRIASQLIDGRSGLERWSATYDRPEGNLLDIQTDISEHVVSALSVELGRSDARNLHAGGTANAEANDLYLRASALVQNDDSEATLQQANTMLDAAIALDPRFAKALAAKSRNLSYLADVGRSPIEIARGYDAAVATAERAISLAPRLAGGYASLADALYGQRKISASARQIRAGLAFAPNDIQLLQSAVVSLVAAGEPKEALAHADRMVDIDPLNPLSHRRRYYALFYDRQYAPCIEEARQTLRLAPDLAMPPYFIALSLIMLGKPKDALPQLEALPADLTVRLAAEAIVADKLGDRKRSDSKLDELQLNYGEAASYQFAQAYAQRGEIDRAFAALERGFAVNDPGLNTLAVDPLLDPLRKDDRFEPMLKRIDVS